MYQYVVNLDTVEDFEQKLSALADTFSNESSAEAMARKQFLYQNLATVRKAIQSAMRLQTDPKGTIAAVFRHNDRTGKIASIGLFKSSKRSARRLNSADNGHMMNVGPKGVKRLVSSRTLRIRRYAWDDRDWILRIINAGTDVRTAKTDVGGRGSAVTYGRRGAIQPGRNAVSAGESEFSRLIERYGEFINAQATDILNQ